MRIFTAFLTAAVLVALSSTHVHAETATESFRLSMPRIRATFTAYSDLLQLLSSDSALLAKYKAVRKSLPSVKTNGADTMGMTAEKLAATEPRVANVFRNAGISAEQSSMTMETLVGIMLGNAMIQATNGKTEVSKLPAYVTENLAFYTSSKADIEAAFQAFAVKARASGKTAAIEDDNESDRERDSEKDER